MSGSGLGIVLDSRQSPNALLRPVAIGAVRIEDEFWAARRRTARDAGLAHQFQMCEETGRIDNFRRASGRKRVEFRGRYYDDSDVYKLLEAASYALLDGPSAELVTKVDEMVGEIVAAQRPDGYINTFFALDREAERYSDLTNKHELYCAGHLIQASIAHRRATGSDRFFSAGRKLADHICSSFGPHARAEADGHEEIELALVELYRETGAAKYLDQALFFLDQRGREPSALPRRPAGVRREYYQDHLPPREQSEAVGHAVRAAYLACGMLDVALERDDPGLEVAATRLWESAFGPKSYVTGGLGALYEGESFGPDYELPNEGAYAETCAAVGGVFWSWRLLVRTGEARYADAIETALYNGALSGIGLDGKSYFYVNPLAARGGYGRAPWFDCACCPPNIARLLMSLPGYLYSTSEDALWVHLYAAGSVEATLPDGNRFAVEISTRYPWEGSIRFHITDAPGRPAALRLRIPGWCREATLKINGEQSPETPTPGTYLNLSRRWRPGDSAELGLQMPVRRIVSHPRVGSNYGRVALARGPLVYCLEGCDHPGVNLADIAIPRSARFRTIRRPDLLGGVTALEGAGVILEGAGEGGDLYRDARAPGDGSKQAVSITAVPYYAWANRDLGPMQVWIPEVARG